MEVKRDRVLARSMSRILCDTVNICNFSKSNTHADSPLNIYHVFLEIFTVPFVKQRNITDQLPELNFVNGRL